MNMRPGATAVDDLESSKGQVVTFELMLAKSRLPKPQ
jgi:hypothetical protein